MSAVIIRLWINAVFDFDFNGLPVECYSPLLLSAANADRVNEWTDERTNERMNEWTNEKNIGRSGI